MITSMKMTIGTLFALLVLLSAPISSVFAGEYSIRPFLIDKVALPRDVIEEKVLLTNDAEFRKYVVFATVNEISVDTTGEIKEFVSPVMTDRTNTITSWVEVTRGRIEIPAGEQKEVPLTFRINHQAEPGEYHAFIGFVPAPNRPAAEAVAMRGEADGVVVKITIADKREDSMKISSFFINRFVTNDDRREIEVVVENKGDITSAPVGEIIFYDSRGSEVAAADFNTDGVEVSPGESVTLKGYVPLEDSLGRFKANISLQYGQNQRAALYDTATFYMMPLHLLMMVFLGILLGAAFVTLLFKKAFLSHDDDHDEDGDEVMVYVRDGHDANPMDHDINLKDK